MANNGAFALTAGASDQSVATGYYGGGVLAGDADLATGNIKIEDVIQVVKKEIGIDVGSGYLHDEKTQAFLEKHYETHRALFRTMWLPYQQRAAMKHQKRLGEF